MDTPGAYLSADMDDEVHVFFQGTFAKLMVAATPALYQPFVSYNRVQELLYAQL